MQKIILGLLLIVAFSACKKEKKCGGSSEKTFSITSFKSIKGGETFAFTIHQGAAFSVKATGCENDLSDLQLSVDNGGTLSIKYGSNQQNRQQVDFDITLPTLSRFILEAAASGTLSGFNQQNADLRVILSGAAKCTINELPALLKADLSGASALTVKGTSSDLLAALSGAATLNAYGASFADADVYTAGTAKAQVTVQNSLTALASGNSRIYYKGNPSVSIEQEGTARVIHE